ncbi:MAG: cyclic 2,3-diphosphoglycerate synthase [Bacillota bacterium]
MKKKNVIIIGAAGRDFHNFNTYYRNNGDYKVVAFTAAQIPDIEDRLYPPSLAGSLYPDGIPIYSEEILPRLIKDLQADECVFSYSDVSYSTVMGISAIVNASGADFKLLGPNSTMIKSSKPVISVCAVRTGSGKSQTSRKVIELLMDRNLSAVVIRHPMPYGNLEKQKVQRFASLDDLQKHNCTIEEMEEYEPHITRGNIVYAGVDYEAILRAAENDPAGCDLIVWDGGNNDFSFYRPDLAITLLDPHRPDHELNYYPGEVNLRMADVAIINKIDSAGPESIQRVENNIHNINPGAVIIRAESKITLNNPELIEGKRVLVIEDGPTLTHGEMKIGAGTIASQRFGAKELVDPRPYIVGKLVDTFETYPDIGILLPAMGYDELQLRDLEETINNTDCESVVIGTPIDLSRIIKINKPFVRVKYELAEVGSPNLDEVLEDFIEKHKL